MQSSLFFFSLFIILTFSVPPQQYKQTSTTNLTANLEKLTYSHNQRLLAGFKNEAEGQFFVINGLRLENMKAINVDDENKERVSPSTFAFSNDDDLLILGSKQGGIYGYKIINNQISQNYEYSFHVGSKIQQNWIRAISFSTQHNKFAISAKTTLIILQRQQTTGNFVENIRYNFTYPIYALAWSIVQPKKIIVGTLSSSVGQFSIYDTQKNTTLEITKDKTQSLAIFPDGKTILKGTVGKDVEVYTYQAENKPILASTIANTNDTKEIYVSSNGLYFALRTNAGQIKAYTVQNSAASSNLKNEEGFVELSQFLLSLNSTGRSLAFSSSGGDIIIIPTDGSAQITKFSLCENKTFFNQKSQICQQCSQNCNTCFNQQICTTCQPDKFISNDDTCQPCGSKLDGCLTCSSSQVCITCNDTADWNAEANKDGKCQCKDTFYNNNGQCLACQTFLDCLSCAGANNCTKCKDQGNFDQTPQQGICVCKQSFWLNQTQCLECSLSIIDCQFCTQDGNKCTKCQSPDRKPNTQQSLCVCVDYKYQDQTTKKCQFCDTNQNCVTCQTQQPHKCMKCDTLKHFQSDAVDGNCLCQVSYFKEQENCKLCSDFLNDCQLCDTKDNCQLCKDQNNFDTKPVQGKCVCIEKWILVDKQCKLCSSQINGCSICSSQTICKFCDDNQHFDKTPVDGTCKCMTEYWLNDKICQLCSEKIIGCSTCSSDGSTCLTCKDQSREPSQDGQSCQCKPFTYENVADKTCLPCDTKHSCKECKAQTDHQCIQCDIIGHWNSTPVAGKCQCMDTYNQYDGKCIFCMVPGCTVCPSQTTCQHCSEDKQFSPAPIKNQCQCKKGTRPSDNKSQCIDCNETILGCKQCSNAHNCQLCDQDNHFTIDTTNDICLCMKGWYLKANQCESCSLAIDNCLYCTVINTNNIQCSKCQKGYGLATKNKLCLSCKAISPGCMNCDESNKCTQCDEDNGFILNGTKCSCTKGFYLKSQSCDLCSTPIPGCKECDDQKTCTACNPDGKFVPQPNAEHKCECVSRWTLDQGKCTQCSVINGCLTCSDVDTCTKCDEYADFQLTDDNKCKCKNGYWIDLTVCKQCTQKITGCLTCSQDGSTCSSCIDPNKIINNQKNKCICQQFMFQNQQNNCQFCDQNKNCKQCTQKDNCTICDKIKKWNQVAVQGKCICQNGYQQWNMNCLLCEVNGCAQCHQENKCFKCQIDNKFNVEPINGQCQCKQNTHLDGDKCYDCVQKLVGCDQCDNLNQCKVCNDKNYFILNQQTKLCQCDTKHYLVTPDCIACSQAINYCSECNIHQDTKQCIKCQKGFTIDTDDKLKCLSCQQQIIGCSDCTDIKTCIQCNKQDNFQPLQDQCVCKKGYFLQVTDCIECSVPIAGCIQCDKDGKQCSLCDQINNFKLNDQTLRCDCTNGYYLNDHQCDKCQSKLIGCENCLNDGSKCLTCQQGFFLLQGQCLQCSTVVPGCSKCSLNGQQCQQCNNPNFIFNQTTNICDCIETYYLKQKQCKLCSSQLISCNKCSMDGKQCLECVGDHFVLNKLTKYCECNNSYYLQKHNSTCQLCSLAITGCSQCNQQGSQCTKCDNEQHFIINNVDNSSCNCVDGYFLNNVRKQCNLCSAINPGCTKCSADGQQSLECNTDNFVLNKESKKCQCVPTYYTASSTECKLCSLSITYCELCSSSSSQSKNNIQNDFTPTCLQCQDSFTLNDQSTQCICSGDNKQIKNGVCKDKQPQTNWIFYGGIAVGSLLVIGACVWIYLKIKRSKLIKLDSYNQLDDQQNNHSRSAKPQTILTDGSGDNTLFKSSAYRRGDEEDQ